MITPLCAAAHLLTRDDARRIAANIAKVAARTFHDSPRNVLSSPNRVSQFLRREAALSP
jgi:hypothetical protein